jgi:hypothetical protein
LGKNWLADGTITKVQYDEIIASARAKSWRIWQPVLYVIPRENIAANRVIEVQRKDRAGYGPEKQIADLQLSEFDVIDFRIGAFTMMSGLENFDKVVAAGILARAALSLAYATSPVTPAIAGEDKVRASIIESARNQLGIKPDDYGAVAIEKLANF